MGNCLCEKTKINNEKNQRDKENLIQFPQILEEEENNNINKPNSYINYSNSNFQNNYKSFNSFGKCPDCIIENQNNKTIIKNIKQINGNAIKIYNNENSSIIIMDHSSSVNIQNCKNCSIFISPCSSTISLKDCQEIYMISASSHLKITGISSGIFYYFSLSPTEIENCNNIVLGNFFVQFTELTEMFFKAKLNIWNNQWSKFHESGVNRNVIYDNEGSKVILIEQLINNFNKCFISYNNYQQLPLVYGKSINLKNNVYKNILIIFKEEVLKESELLKTLFPDELDAREIKLISTIKFREQDNEFQKIIFKLETNSNNNINNDDLLYYLKTKNLLAKIRKNSAYATGPGNSSIMNNSTSGKGLRLNEFDLTNKENERVEVNVENIKFLAQGDVLFLWFINDKNDSNLNIFKEYIENTFEPKFYGWITSKEFNCNENDFQNYLINLFGLD